MEGEGQQIKREGVKRESAHVTLAFQEIGILDKLGTADESHKMF